MCLKLAQALEGVGICDRGPEKLALASHFKDKQVGYQYDTSVQPELSRTVAKQLLT